MKDKKFLITIAILGILCAIYSIAALSISRTEPVEFSEEVVITPIPEEVMFNTFPNDEHVEAVGWFLTSNNTRNGTVGELEIWWRNKERNVKQLVPYDIYLEFIDSRNRKAFYNVKINGVYGEKIQDGQGEEKAG